jgi:TM2 domain-containing membrane protein YozV
MNSEVMFLKKIVVILFCFAGAGLSASSGADLQKEVLITVEEVNLHMQQFESSRPSPLIQKIRLRKAKNKKVTAALLAFPFPCGIVGLHRIYLGSAPYVPIVYIATLGGALGILPFIDFCVLLIDNELEPYINNDKVFMWVK